MVLILASQSPRRRDLLASAGLTFEVRVTGLEEIRNPGEPAADYVERLARDKAFALDASPGEWILAADTTVVAGDELLEKPSSPEDAVRMIRLLAGAWHEVLTGVCLRDGSHCWTAVESTRVHFVPMSEAEIQEYVASGEPMDKAGAYGIQGLASRFIDRVDGCYFNVVGLPVARVFALLKTAGYKP